MSPVSGLRLEMRWWYVVDILSLSIVERGGFRAVVGVAVANGRFRRSGTRTRCG